ncbi:MAG: response regulator [Candidatus Magasanikbacteria bacterium]|nr:response regulator [Candidatus Magasanikbacteria bacterium]
MFGKKSKGKVMVVEDDALLSQVLSKGFVSEGFEVAVVGNGLEALDLVTKFKPGMIFLDLMLPGIDGFEVLKRLKEDSDTSAIPVVIMSNLDQIADVKSAKVLGAEEYFIKANTQLDKIIGFARDRLK